MPHERIQNIYHKGKKLIFIDLSHLEIHEETDILMFLNDALEFMLNAGDNLLVLVDIRNSFGSKRIIERMKEDSKIEQQYIRKQAVVGVDGTKVQLFNSIKNYSGVNMQFFESEDDAKNWLVE